ncbi:type III secretion apparatus assembly chaperone SctY [Rugamonas aquatica]|uniref:Tetratricopeptide repeat protein n=1 Tax=Rugamonas aquatica TaxID=2743357 RepID=A0A6A7N747_9BURK|nr:hypothetical protein [Rugamonas aquatica]MQA40708.1 hypothetical protein [Rugamonas aquatica]
MSSNALDLIQLLAYVYVQNGAPCRAESLYAALHVLEPDNSIVAKALAWASIEAGQPLQALKVLDGVVGPREPDALLQLLRARAFARLERDDDAHVAMQAFLALRTAAARVVP